MHRYGQVTGSSTMRDRSPPEPRLSPIAPHMEERPATNASAGISATTQPTITTGAIRRPRTHRPPASAPERCESATATLCVPKTSSTSCDHAIFVDQATGANVSSDAVLLKIDRFGQRFQRRGAVQGAVRPMLIVVGLVLAQDLPQMGLVPDESAVQELSAACRIRAS